MIGFGMIFDFGLFFWVGIGISLLLDAVLVDRFLLEPLGFLPLAELESARLRGREVVCAGVEIFTHSEGVQRTSTSTC
jgi:hypothetical protein